MLARILHDALTGDDHFEALALVAPESGEIVFMDMVRDVPRGFGEALERFIMRLMRYRDGFDQLDEVNKVIFYDLDNRQIVCNRISSDEESYILIVVTGPKKAYKRATKRLLKNLQETLDKA